MGYCTSVRANLFTLPMVWNVSVLGEVRLLCELCKKDMVCGHVICPVVRSVLLLLFRVSPTGDSEQQNRKVIVYGRQNSRCWLGSVFRQYAAAVSVPPCPLVSWAESPVDSQYATDTRHPGIHSSYRLSPRDAGIEEEELGTWEFGSYFGHNSFEYTLSLSLK